MRVARTARGSITNIAAVTSRDGGRARIRRPSSSSRPRPRRRRDRLSVRRAIASALVAGAGGAPRVHRRRPRRRRCAARECPRGDAAASTGRPPRVGAARAGRPRPPARPRGSRGSSPAPPAWREAARPPARRACSSRSAPGRAGRSGCSCSRRVARLGCACCCRERPNGSQRVGRTPRASALAQTRWRVEIDVDRAVRRASSATAARCERFRAVVGAPATPTPLGLFALAEVAPQPDRRRVPRALTALHLTAHSDVLDDYGGGPGRVAIHGRGAESLLDPLGTARSHGCIRIDMTPCASSPASCSPASRSPVRRGRLSARRREDRRA